jgi:reverse gyrase
MLRQTPTGRVLIFTRTEYRARNLARDIEKGGYRAAALQGNMSQSQRQKAINGFRNGKYDILVATDVAARGIDVSEISHVINFDIPDTVDAYTQLILITVISYRKANSRRAIQSRYERYYHPASGTIFFPIKAGIDHVAARLDKNSIRNLFSLIKRSLKMCTLLGNTWAMLLPAILNIPEWRRHIHSQQTKKGI